MSWDMVRYIATDEWVNKNRCGNAAVTLHPIDRLAMVGS